jgi:hypothetical protein
MEMDESLFSHDNNSEIQLWGEAKQIMDEYLQFFDQR